MKDIKAILGLVMIKAVLFEFFRERISCFDRYKTLGKYSKEKFIS